MMKKVLARRRRDNKDDDEIIYARMFAALRKELKILQEKLEEEVELLLELVET